MTFRIGTQITWGIGLIAAALILGKKADDPLPWAVGILGLIVVIGVCLSAVAEESASKQLSTTRTPGASGT